MAKKDDWVERKNVQMKVRRCGKWLQIQIGTTKLIAREVDEFKEPRAEGKKVLGV